MAVGGANLLCQHWWISSATMGNGHAGKCDTSSSPVTPRATPATLGTGKGNAFNRNTTRNTNRGQCKTERDKSQSDEIKLKNIG